VFASASGTPATNRTVRQTMVPEASAIEPLGDAVPLVAVIVVHWMNMADTVECLSSLAEVDYHQLQVILVNNGSPDFDEEAARQALPEVQILAAPTNLGFAAGNNLGIAYALDGAADFVLLLNNDTTVDPDLVRAMLPAFKDPRVGIAGPIITYYDAPARVWSAGGTYNRWLGYTLNPQMDRPLTEVLAEGDRTVDYINGCALMARREVFQHVGGLWEAFFLYFEETDLCLRARRAGFSSRLVARPLVRHKVSASGGQRGSNVLTPSKAYYFGRNVFHLLRRHARGWWAVTGVASQFLVVFPYYLWQSLRARRPGVMASYLVGMWDGIRGRAGRRTS
jgi:GT2 family glycosyltransferase